MKKYWYRALDANSMIVKGVLSADSRAHLEKILEGQNKEIIKIGRCFTLNFFKRQCNSFELIEVCIQLQSFLAAKLPLIYTLRSIHGELTNPSLKQAIEETMTRVDGGASLSKCFEFYPHIFDKVFTSLIKAGEETGEIEISLNHLIDYLKWKEQIKSKSKKALNYPILLICMIMGVILILFTTLIPQLVNFFNVMDVNVPLITQSLLTVSETVERQGVFCLLGISLFTGVIYVMTLFHPPSKILVARLKLRLPVLGETTTTISLMRFFHMVSFMTSSHIPLLKAIKVSAASVKNTFLNTSLAQIGLKIRDGQKFSEAIKDCTFITPFIHRMLKVGEQSGNLDKILQDINYFYEREAEHRTTHLLKFLEPTLLLFLGGVILWIALAIFYPLYNSLTLMDV